MSTIKEIFKGGQNAESVVRIGDIVYRSKADNNKFSQSVLRHLEDYNFEYSPRFLGTDENGKTKLSYIEGEVPRGKELNEEQLGIAIRILRKFHDINSRSSLCKNEETICHNDFAPWNIIINNGIPVGVIDFDEVAPGSRIDDVAYFIWTFLDLGVAKVPDKLQVNRITKLCATYNLETSGSLLVKAILKQQKRILDFRKEIVLNEKNEAIRNFSIGAITRIQASIQWVMSNRNTIEKNAILKSKHL